MKQWTFLICMLAFTMQNTAMAGAAAPPFFLFSTSKFANDGERDGIFAALRKHSTDRDYLSSRLGALLPDLADRIGRSRLYALPPSLRSIERTQAKGCGFGAPGLIVYDGEHWNETPVAEQIDMPNAIARGKLLIRRSAACHEYGVAPDGRYIGLLPNTCEYDITKAIHRKINWSDIALFNIQAQRLLSNDCVAKRGVDAYVLFVTAIVKDVRKSNARTKISTQMSFRDAPPDRMIAAIIRLRGVVDGFYIAYPSNIGPPCRYCSPNNLDTVLTALRT
jgi:hypothetical protein